MAMFEPIPLPGLGGDVYKDVMDYFETLQKRRSDQLQKAKELAETQREFGINKGLEQQKLNLLKQKLDIMRENANNPKLSAQEKVQAMKLVDAGRSLQSVAHRANKLSNMLETKPGATGWIPGAKEALGFGSEDTSEFNQTAGMLQADMAKFGSQRGGAQALKWAERVKPGKYKSNISNKGYIKSIIDDSNSDFEDIKNEYETLTGRPYPIEMPTTNTKSVITVVDSNGDESQIYKENLPEAKKRDPGLKVKGEG